MELEGYFDCKLNLPLGNRGTHQDTGSASRIAGGRRQGCSGCIKDVGVPVSGTRRRKVWMVEDIVAAPP
jgi:hypothetical protein